MPSTRPRASSSGPPELPWLIAASVWIAPVIAKPVSESIERSSAETTPTDSDCSSPNGVPIAATGAPTIALARRAERQRAQRQARRGRPAAARRRRSGRSRRSRPRPGCRRRSARRPAGALADRRALAGGDDVRVGGDLAVARDHEARAEAGLVAAAVGSPRPERDDRHDARRLALVDRRAGRSAPPGRASPRVLERPRRASSCVCARDRPASPAAAAAGGAAAARPRAPRRPARGASRRAAPARTSCGPGTLSARSSPVHALGQLARDREAEAGALRVVGGEERLEDVLGIAARLMPGPKSVTASRTCPLRARRR